MDLFTGVEIFTQVITYVMIVSGIPSCIDCVKTKSTRNAPWAFILVGFTNSILTTGYGLMVQNHPIIQMNAVATLVNIAYILAYVYASRDKMKPFRQVGGSLMLLTLIYLFIVYIVSPSNRPDILGLFLLLLTMTLLLTPLIQFKQCLDEQSASCLSMSLLVAGTLCCIAWSWYGVLLNDFYIYAPNVVGMVPNICQIGAIMRYGRDPPKSIHVD